MAHEDNRHEREDSELLELFDLFEQEIMSIGDEVEAFLAGDLAGYWSREQAELAPWMVLNRLAHGSRLLLNQIVSDGHGWLHEARRPDQKDELELAHLLVDAFPTANQLRTAQLEVLVPLELELASAPVQPPPHAVMALAMAGIEAYLVDRHRGRHS